LSDRRIVCPCEDVTDKDIGHAIALGHADLESVKRYTGVATGPCQGKQCLLACRALLVELTGKAPSEIGSIVHRPPVSPLPLGLLAGEVEK
jgi:bacterioferritin-associated ferredoxin